MTKTEQIVLQTLWNSEKPMCAAEILENNPGLKEITLRVTIKKMVESKLIKVGGMTQRTKAFARVYLPNITQEELYLKSAKVDTFKFACALLEEDTLSEEQLETLKSMIDERIKKKL